MSTDLAIGFTDGSAAPAGYGYVNLTTGEMGSGSTPSTPTPLTQGSTTSGPAIPPTPATVVSPPVVDGHRSHRFEGSEVGMTEIKISGACAIDTVGDVTTVSLDDLVRAVGTYRVTKVLHYVHPKTGETVRQQVLTPVEPLMVVPWDSSNPNDDGIVRAR